MIRGNSSGPYYIAEGIPKEWTPRIVFGFPSDLVDGHRTIEPRDEWTETIRLNRFYDNITRGRTRLTISWQVCSAHANHPIVANPKMHLDLVIREATTERLAALRDRLMCALDRTDLKSEERREITDTMLDTRHAALLPVAWRLLETYSIPVFHNISVIELASYIETHSETRQDVTARLIKLVCDPNWGGKAYLFECYWRTNQPNLDRQNLHQLSTANNVWTSILAYITIPKRHDPDMRDALFARMHDLNRPLPDVEFARLLHCLDDDSFEEREIASADLEAKGERVEEQLRHCLTQPLSAEAARRVRAVLDKLKDAKQPRDCIDTLAYLKNLDTPEAQKVLEALAEGTAKTWLRKEAQTILDQKKKRFAP